MDLKNKIKFIYFDLDNTLWDFRRNTIVALEKLYNEKILNIKKISIDFDYFRDVYTNHNEELWRAFERGETTAEELKVKRFNRTIEELGITDLVKAEELNVLYINNLVKLPNLMPNAKEILEYLSPNYRLGILSNGFEKGQYKKMNNSGIINYFVSVITSDGTGVSKPHPKIFLDAIEKSGFQPQEIAYVGDDYIVDTIAANKMGIIGILLDPQNRVDDEDIIKISNLIELKEYF